jgi:glycosyltransferase involved in cell wall biosynthesis
MNNRPLVSFLLFAYKQEEFVREAIRGAFSQTYEHLEIILSDDCSPDRTFEIIKEEAQAYQGPHHIIINRNEKNLGLASHINHVFAMAKGAFWVMAAGDDISVPERTEILVNRWQNKKNPVDLVCSYFEEMDVNGKSTGFTKQNVMFSPDISEPVHKWKCGATGACAGYSRLIYDKYGPLDTRIIAEDWIFSFRAWLESGMALVEQPLVRHRTHANCLSVIYKDVKKEKDPSIRALLRKKSTAGKLALFKEWLQAVQVAGKFKNENIELELKESIKLLELEWRAYDSGRIGALIAAIRSFAYQNGAKSALRLIVRQVIGFY